jgi:aryl carrier-like protein
MDNSNSDQVNFEPSKLALGQAAAHVFDIEPESLDWNVSFITLGGDSILAIDFIIKCREAGVFVEMADLLTADSLAQLADEIDERNAGEAGAQNGYTNGAVKEANAEDETWAEAEATAQNDSDELAASAAPVGRRLRFAALKIIQGKELPIVLTALGRIVFRHSALRSTWSVSSMGRWTLTTEPASTTEGHRPFFCAEVSEPRQMTDALDSLREALLSAGAPSLGCLIMPSDTPATTHTIVLAADADLVAHA